MSRLASVRPRSTATTGTSTTGTGTTGTGTTGSATTRSSLCRAPLIVGAFGQGNPGDEALLAASVMVVRASAGWEPVVATAEPEATSAALDVATVPATAPATARAASTADALVVGGGTLFKELSPASGRPRGALLRNAALLVQAMKWRARPVLLLGVGAAPITSPRLRRLARSIARRADLLIVRDPESARLLVELGVAPPVRVAADLAWLTLPGAPPTPTPPGAPIGVALSHLAGDDALVDALGGALEPLADLGHRIELEPWQGSPRLGADARMARQLAARLDDAAIVVPSPGTLGDAVGRDASRSVVVALRFHAAVAAAESRTPFLAVAHEPKLAGIADRMRQPRVAPDATAAEIGDGLAAAIAGGPAVSSAVAREHDRAEAMAELTGLVLSGAGAPRGLELIDLVPPPVPA